MNKGPEGVTLPDVGGLLKALLCRVKLSAGMQRGAGAELKLPGRHGVLLLRLFPPGDQRFSVPFEAIGQKTAMGYAVPPEMAHALTQFALGDNHGGVHVIDQHQRPDGSSGFTLIRIPVLDVQFRLLADRGAKF